MASLAESSEDEDCLGFTTDDRPSADRECDIESDISVSESKPDDDDFPLSDLRPLAAGNTIGNRTTTTPVVEPVRWSGRLEKIAVNDFTQPTGPINVLPKESTELDFLNLIFTEELYTLLVDQTNLYAKQCTGIEKKSDNRWIPVTIQEMKAFMGIHVVISIIQLPTYKQYWSTDQLFRVPSIPIIMTRDRFEKILQYFHCNDSTTNPARGDANHDKIHHVRPVFSIVQRPLVENYRPHKSVTIDEAIIPFRGRVSYQQYLPAKPCKFGVKVWQLADSSNGYVYQMQVYTGKQDTGREVGLASRVVWDLTRVLSGKSHHIYMDTYFSSPQLYQDLLKDGLYACGTCRLNRKGWPDALHKNCLPKQKGASKLYQKENLVAACWYDNRQVNFLSTNSDPTVTVSVQRKQKDGTRAEIKTPAEVVENYNKHMNGVYHGDQLRMQYSSTHRSKKFWKYLFWFLFDTAVACSFILMRESLNHQKKSKTGRVKEMCQLEFRQNLAKQLVGQHRQKRRHEVLQKDSAGRSHWPTSMPKSRRCKLCSSRKIRKESKYGCKICDANLCVECFEPFHVLAFTEE